LEILRGVTLSALPAQDERRPQEARRARSVTFRRGYNSTALPRDSPAIAASKLAVTL